MACEISLSGLLAPLDHEAIQDLPLDLDDLLLLYHKNLMISAVATSALKMIALFRKLVTISFSASAYRSGLESETELIGIGNITSSGTRGSQSNINSKGVIPVVS